MAGKDLVIRISGDVSSYSDALKAAEGETEDLSDTLNKVALASGVAFAALTAEVYLSVKAFNVEAQALDEVNQALQNQGIYSETLARRYRDVAEAIEAKTGVDSDQISMAQASAQALIGQTEITDDLTRAVVDFATRQKLDLNSAFGIVSKAINGNVTGLQKMGIVIDETGTKQQRLQQVTEALSLRYEGAAEAAAKAQGSTVLLESAFGNLQKELGRRFAPIFDAVVRGLTGFINTVKDNKPLLDFTVSVIVASTAVAGAGLVVGVAGAAYLKLRAALIAAQIATNAMTVATRALVGATGLGLVVLVLTEIYLNWSTFWPRMTAIFNAFANNITEVAKGIGQILLAVFLPGPDTLTRIQAGAKQVAEAVKKGYAEATANTEQYGPNQEQGQDAGKKSLADANEARTREQEQRKLDTIRASRELIKLEEEKASLDMISLKKREIDILKSLEEEKDAATKAAQLRRLEDNRAQQDEQAQIDRERRTLIQEQLLAENEAYQAMTAEQQQRFRDDNIQKLEQDALTRRTIAEKIAQDELKAQIDANNKFLIEEQKFGTAYATINKAMHTNVYQGTKNAFGELAQLQESSNSTLKAIGKVAATANIIIKTAESAMNIYAGFSTIPIVGPALGVAGAAAAVAFGAEQLGKVQGAAKGGLAQGGIPGKDSIPFMLQDQELVAPSKNFEEVIGSVRASREAEKFLPGGSGSSGGGDMMEVLRSIEQKLSQNGTQIVVQGDFLGDEAVAQKLGQAISDQIQYNNLRFVGVNT